MSIAALSTDDRDKLARIGVVTRSSSDVQEERMEAEVEEDDDLGDIEEVGEIVEEEDVGKEGGAEDGGYGFHDGEEGAGLRGAVGRAEKKGK